MRRPRPRSRLQRLVGPGRGRSHPQRPGHRSGRRRHHRSRGFRGGHLAAGRSLRQRADNAAGHGRRRCRRQDRHQHRPRARTWSAPSTNPPPCCATSRCWRSLPQPEYLSGMAEVVKCGFVADPAILDLVEADPRRAAAFDPELTSHLRGAQRPREGRRDRRRPAGDQRLRRRRDRPRGAQLRAHARPRHRTARGVPLAPRPRGVGRAGVRRCPGTCSRASSTPASPTATASTLSALGLPVSYRADAFADLRVGMQLDKKTRGATLRFVVLLGAGRTRTAGRPRTSRVLREAWAAVAA